MAGAVTTLQFQDLFGNRPTQVWDVSGTGAGPFYPLSYAASAASQGIASTQTTVASGSIILKASAGLLYGASVTAGASAGYLMIFDAATVPADGTVTPKAIAAVAATSSVHLSYGSAPLVMATGIVLVFSTTGQFSKTISNTAFLTGQCS